MSAAEIVYTFTVGGALALAVIVAVCLIAEVVREQRNAKGRRSAEMAHIAAFAHYFPCPECGHQIHIDNAGSHGKWHADQTIKEINTR